MINILNVIIMLVLLIALGFAFELSAALDQQNAQTNDCSAARDATMASQNLPGLAVMQANGFKLQPAPLFLLTGISSAATAFFGGHSSNLAAITAAICTGKVGEDGVLNADTGRAFREAILARGGSQAPMVLFVDFRGRAPSIDALLRHSGLSEDAAA